MNLTLGDYLALQMAPECTMEIVDWPTPKRAAISLCVSLP